MSAWERFGNVENARLTTRDVRLLGHDLGQPDRRRTTASSRMCSACIAEELPPPEGPNSGHRSTEGGLDPGVVV